MIIIKLIEIAAITPPVGLNLYAVLAVTERRLQAGALIRGSLPFILIEFCVPGLLIAFPWLVTSLPARM